MFENGKFVKIESIYVSEKKPDVAYVRLNSPEFQKWGECKVRMEGISPEVFALMHEMGTDFPYVLTADVALGVWGSGQDETNTITLSNIRWDDPLNSLAITRQMRQAAEKVMLQMSGSAENGKRQAAPAPQPEKAGK